MNLLSYEASNRRLLERGFVFSGNIENDISQTISLLRAGNKMLPPPHP
jgi:hypothetical protein